MTQTPKKYRALRDDEILEIGKGIERMGYSGQWVPFEQVRPRFVGKCVSTVPGFDTRAWRIEDTTPIATTATTTDEQSAWTYRPLRDDDIMVETEWQGVGGWQKCGATEGIKTWGQFRVALGKSAHASPRRIADIIYRDPQEGNALLLEVKPVDDEAEERRRQMRFFFGFERKVGG